jgi:hypothetical protein
VFKSARIAALVIGLAACSAPRQQASPPVQLSQNPSLPAVGTYRIDSSRSELRVLVYRAGPLSILGHNHVMVNRGLSGSVRIAATLLASSFSLSMPVDGFEVDAAASRREEGGDFPGDIPDDDKSATLHNMLGPALLDSARFPIMAVNSTALLGEPGALNATVSIEVAGRVSTLRAPCVLKVDPHRLTITGSLELRQTALGLTPYSLLHGALQVQDAMRVMFKIIVPTD